MVHSGSLRFQATGHKALQAVVEPARRRSEKPPIINLGTATAVVRFVAGASEDAPLAEIHSVQPPLLSVICAEMNDQRLKAGSDCIETDQLVGRSEDILRTFYEECFELRPAAFRPARHRLGFRADHKPGRNALVRITVSLCHSLKIRKHAW